MVGGFDVMSDSYAGVNSFKNINGITKIILSKKVHCYCRLGGDWYTNQISISFKPVFEIPDYIRIDHMIEKRCEQKSLLLEECVDEIYKIIKEECPSATNIRVESYVDDSVPKNMMVRVVKEDEI